MSTRTLQTLVNISVRATAKNTLGSTPAVGRVGRDFALASITSGVGANEADRVFFLPSDEGLIKNGENQIVDVYDFEGLDGGSGDGKDPLGQSLSMYELIGFYIYKTGNGTLTVEPDPDFAGWDYICTTTLGPGVGMILKYHPGEAGLPVLDGTSHRVKLSASGDHVRWEGLFVGRSRSDETSSSSSSSSSTSSQSTLSSISSTSSWTSLDLSGL